jgi:hypothetical protein
MRTLWCILVVMSGQRAPASEAGDWDGLVKRYVEAYESVKEPKPIAYPWMAKRLKTLFGVRGVGHIQVFGETEGRRTPTADIYYKAGEVHLINHEKGWNLVTKGKEAYEWKFGNKEGLITKLTDKDLIKYLIYQTEPFYLMTNFYHDALYEPDKFLPPKEVERGLIERRFKEPVLGGFRAVFVSDEPAWLSGLEFGDPEGGKPVRVIYSKPESIKEVPARVFEQLKGVKFKKSDRSIRRHMEYF